MGSKTPGRAVLKSLTTWGGNGEDVGGGWSGKVETTVDIGALMRKRKQTLLVPSSGIGGCGGSGGRLDAMAENPTYSPDDSLAKAASKLQSLKALRSGPVPPVRPLGVLPAPKPDLGAMPPNVAPQPLSSLNPLRAAQRAAAAAPLEQQLSGEDSGELAALGAVQQRRKSMHAGSSGGSVQEQRYGQFWQGDDCELEDALHEYNRTAPEPATAASPRMTRARRRKSMAVERPMPMHAGSAASVKGEEEEEGGQEEEEEERQEEGEHEPVAGQAQQGSGVAAEVAAISAGLCDQLEGCIEESPEKRPRTDDGRSLRDKLLDSWGGRTYYERLQEMSQEKAGQEGKAPAAAGQPARQQERQQGATQQPAGPQTSCTPVAKAGASRPAASLASPAQARAVQLARFTPAAKASRPKVQMPNPTPGSSAAAAKAGLPTPNSQRRKLNELTQSLQLLKVTTRHRQALAAEAASAAVGAAASATAAAPRGGPPAAASKAAERVSSPPLLQEAATAAPGAAAGRARRARSTTPEAVQQLGGEGVPLAAASNAQPSAEAVAPRTASRRSARRGGSSSPTEGSGTASAPDWVTAAAAAAAATSAACAAAPSPGCSEDALRADLAAARQLLGVALADKARLAGQLHSAAQAAAEERGALVAAEQQVQRLAADLAASAKERQELAAALAAAEQRSRQLSKELAEAQQGAGAASAAASDRASEMEARWAEAGQALQAVLKAANSGLRVVAAGKEEARVLTEARGGDAAVGAAASARQQRQSGGGRWR